MNEKQVPASKITVPFPLLARMEISILEYHVFVDASASLPNSLHKVKARMDGMECIIYLLA